MKQILVLYYSLDYPLRATINEHLYSFRDYSPHRCIYINLAISGIPKYIYNLRFDLIIFHTVFLSTRWNLEKFSQLCARAAPIKQFSGIKIALPQDEFIHTDVLCQFINDFGIDYVFTVAPESEWRKIYASVNSGRVKFHKVLTGYLDEKTVERITRLAAASQHRPYDIGYRAWKAEPWLGRRGYLKTKIAEVFENSAKRAGLTANISLDPKDTFLGDDWFRFLLSCKYTIGVEGGAAILDHDGTIREKTMAYLQENPDADFDEVEVACFPGKDDTLSLFAISPRHLEACATRTCQVLIEGDYNGILEAGKHYIALKDDFSNLDQVIAVLAQDDKLHMEMTERAFQDIVASGEYTYKSFVAFVCKQSMRQHENAASTFSLWDSIIYRWMSTRDKLSWETICIRTKLVKFIRSNVSGLLPLISRGYQQLQRRKK